MPTPPRRRCPRPGCPHPQPCPTHRKPQARSKYADLYESKPWRTLAATILDEDRLCPGYHPHGTPIRCGRRTTQVDHVTALDDGGAPLDRTNLQALCSSCHGRKSAHERAPRAARELRRSPRG